MPHENPDDLCPQPVRLPPPVTEPLVPPLHLSSVYECSDPQQADALLGGRESGYVYRRDGHPNADVLAERCRQLYGAERAALTASGMGALALLVLSQLKYDDHVVVSDQLYGRSLGLLAGEAGRFRISNTVVDACNLRAVRLAITPQTRLIVVESISNPLLHVADLAALAEIAHERGVALVADNTLAGPIICRPSELGVDFSIDSITKSMNGHSDVLLGLLCGPAERWQRVPTALSTWGLASAPFDCWLALRGLATLALRVERACANALAVAQMLVERPQIERVHYPGLPSHPQHELARRQFGKRFGSMVSFTLAGGTAAAESFIAAARDLPFCPSLGELSTTLSHPESTSHRALSSEARSALGITGGTIRLSIGIESPDTIIARIQQGLASR